MIVTLTARYSIAGLSVWLLLGCRPGETAGLDPDPSRAVSIRIEPQTASLSTTDTLRFRSVALNALGQGVSAAGVRFEATGGSIDAAGLFRATDAGNFEVRARLQTSAGELTAAAAVSVLAPTPPVPPPPPPPPP